MLVAAEAFRYKVTNNATAKYNAWNLFKGMQFLVDVSGVECCMCPSVRLSVCVCVCSKDIRVTYCGKNLYSYGNAVSVEV